MSAAAFEGRWAWEGEDPATRYIVFSPAGDTVEFSLVTGGSVTTGFYNLSPDKTSSPPDLWFLCNNWLSRDRKRLFRFESQYATGENGSIFINASEFTLSGPDRMVQKLMGYRFEPGSEQWVPFNSAHVLNRIP